MAASRVIEDLSDIAERSSPLLVAAMRRLAQAEVASDVEAKRVALEDVAGIVARAMARADLSGRKRQRERRKTGKFQDVPDILLDNVPQVVRRLYLEQHGPSIAQLIDANLVERIEAAFSAGFETATETIQEISGWSRAYADTVYRTNLTTAYAAGQWQEALDPDVLEFAPAFQYDATGDKDTRPNHQAMEGLLAGKTDSIWNTFAIPNGFNCRCALREVDRFELEERGLLLANGQVKRVIPPTFGAAHPDPGFDKGRPDQRIYGLLGR